MTYQQQEVLELKIVLFTMTCDGSAYTVQNESYNHFICWLPQGTIFTETFDRHDLTNANYNQEDGFPNGPISDTLQEKLRLPAVTSLSESLPSL